VHGNVSQMNLRMKIIFCTPYQLPTINGKDYVQIESVNFVNYLTPIHMSATIVFNFEPPHVRNTNIEREKK
jgi:hypothetical protein